jgi:hypothetical protein
VARHIAPSVEASSTPTICRLSDSHRHQLSAIAPFVHPATDCATQHEQTVWLSFDAKFIERI